jgi:hypothetical protein
VSQSRAFERIVAALDGNLPKGWRMRHGNEVVEVFDTHGRLRGVVNVTNRSWIRTRTRRDGDTETQGDYGGDGWPERMAGDFLSVIRALPDIDHA